MEKEGSLFHSAMHQNWSSALVRAEEFPNEIIQCRDFDGLNVIHMACCRRAPVSFLRQLYNINPPLFQKATETLDSRGMTPLLMACANRTAVSIIDFLLETTPKESILVPDKDGWTVLHFLACWPLISWNTLNDNLQQHPHARGIGHDRNDMREERIPSPIVKSFLPSARKLVELDRDIALKINSAGYTPLHLLVSTYQVELTFFYHSASPRQKLKGSFIGDLWRIIELFVGMSEPDVDADDSNKVCRIDRRRNKSILHRFLDIPSCPVLLIMLACRLFPEQLLDTDEYGNTPLHMAIMKQNTSLVQFLLYAEPKAAYVVNINRETPFCVARIHAYSQQWHDQIHAILLKIHPAAVHRAYLSASMYAKIFHRFSTTATSLCDRNEIARILDGPNQSSMSTGKENCSPSTVFEILRSAPMLFQ